MEQKILVTGEGVRQEIIGESLFDCADTAYRRFRGKQVELTWLRPIGYVDGNDLFIDDEYLDRQSVKEIMKNGDGPLQEGEGE
ncbi:hypothetical protein ACFLZM_00800 [Thermodesulfobacteriota bacterium]